MAIREPVTSVGGIVNSAPRAFIRSYSGLEVIREEHRRGPALLEDRLLVSPCRGVIVQRQLQLRTVRFLGRGHREPAKRPLGKL